jgi:hypothetical protein
MLSEKIALRAQNGSGAGVLSKTPSLVKIFELSINYTQRQNKLRIWPLKR